MLGIYLNQAVSGSLCIARGVGFSTACRTQAKEWDCRQELEEANVPARTSGKEASPKTNKASAVYSQPLSDRQVFSLQRRGTSALQFPV